MMHAARIYYIILSHAGVQLPLKPKLRRFKCGLQGCTGRVQRLDLHLVKVHHMKQSSDKYNHAKSLAMRGHTDSELDETWLEQSLNEYW